MPEELREGAREAPQWGVCQEGLWPSYRTIKPLIKLDIFIKAGIPNRNLPREACLFGWQTDSNPSFSPDAARFIPSSSLVYGEKGSIATFRAWWRERNRSRS